MLRLVILAVAVSVVTSLPAKLPNPAELALYLNEEEFEDYLDKWLAVQQITWTNNTARDARSGCTLNVNGDFGQPQPVFLRQNTNSYLLPTGNSGQVTLNSGEQITVACTGSGRTIQHPNILTSVATATAQCVNSNLVSGSSWLNGNREFGLLTCSSHAYHEAQETNERCFNNNVVIQVGFTVNNVFYPLYRSCFDKNRFEVLYVWYEQNPSYAVHQTGVDRPSWLAGNFFPGVTINSLYTQVQQKQAITRAVGDTLADQYVTSTQFLARGHLIAKSDQIFATGQRATFYFINAVPQWQPFNAGNWNTLEQALRSRIGVAGYDCVIYTGAFGVTQLRDSNGRFVDIYLDNTDNNERLPVPLYMYKVAYDESRRIGTAFISINNPHYTAAEARALQFCTDRCHNNAAFNWLSWQPDRVDIGYSFCCSIDDFTRRISHLPSMTVNGLLSVKIC